MTCAAAVWCAVARVQAADVQVRVDANDTVRVMDDLMVGLNTAVWDNAFKDPETLALLKAADVRTLRFPGGSTSNTYDWKTNRSYQTGTRTLNDWEWTNDFDDFAAVALALKAKVYITANYGSGTPEQAAAWVKYSNREKGYGFKYWEIGNENYGDWEEDLHALKHHPETYADEAKTFMALMRAEDPTIKIGVVVLAEEESWTPRVLARLAAIGAVPDFVVYHRYPYGPGMESDAGLLAGGTVYEANRTWAVDAAAIREMVDEAFGAAGAQVEIHMTENNSVWTQPGRQSTSLVNGLFYADSFGQILQTEFQSFVWWALHNGPPEGGNLSNSLYGWRNYGDYGVLSTTNDPHPTYWVMKLLKHFARAGDRIVHATSDAALVSAYASKRTNGMLSVLLINKSPTAAANVTLAVDGFAAFPAAPVLSYGIPQDEAARVGSGGKEMGMGAARGAGGSFTTTLAPYSVNVVTMYPAGVSSRLSALSVRAVAGGESQSLTNGFVIGGAGGTMPILVRCVGPSLAAQGLTSGFLADPVLALHKIPGSEKFAENDNWGGAEELMTAFARLGMSPLQSANSGDSALYYEGMAPGAYTAVVNPKGGGGVALAEVYDASTTSTAGTPRLLAISGRAQVNTGNDVLIGGFVIVGDGPKTVMVRGVGPALAPLGVQGSLATPRLELHRAGVGVVATNTAWGGSDEMVALFKQLGLQPTLENTRDSKDTALLVTLTPGVYTAVISGVNNATGVALLEIYEVE
jgi:Alpha-L-arabinofuranosidase